MTEQQEARAPAFYTVAAGRTPKRCKSYPKCMAMIFLIRSPHDITRWLPIDCDPERVPGATMPTATDHGRGIIHFATCTDPDKHRRPRAKPTTAPSEQVEMAVNHRAHACIFCGCTSNKRCSIKKEDLDAVEMDVHIGRLDVIGAHELPDVVHCYFMKLKPPVCSACKGRLGELTPAQRVQQ